jgi:hypothetical protein
MLPLQEIAAICEQVLCAPNYKEYVFKLIRKNVLVSSSFSLLVLYPADS